MTVDDHQYVAWVASSAQPIIGHRALPDGEWETFDLSTVSGNPLGAIALDNHNTLNIGVDADGYIHLVGNQHTDALNYLVSSDPHDITAWTTPGMTGSNESSVTYPRFVSLPGGGLLFFYRDGGSGAGDVIMNTYSTDTGWSQDGVIIDGTSGVDDENPYLQHIGVDWATGDVHVMFMWRTSSLDAATNNDLCYATLDASDGKWKNSGGAEYTLPITHATAEVAVDTDATGSGLLNQSGMEVDSLGRPHAAVWLYDGSGFTQLHHVWFDGSAWQNDQVTAWETTRWPPHSRPSVLTYDERVFIAYRENESRYPPHYKFLEVGADGVVAEFALFSMDVGRYEFTFDTRALKEREELIALIAPTERDGADAATWGRVPLVVMTLALEDIDQLPKV